ncbi:MAG: tetratricopeptide repeat protein, partial [Candidatus Methanofastidiosia archaeon]
KKAEKSYTEALKIYRTLAQKDPTAYEPDVAMTLNNLGNLYWNLRDFKKAEKSFTEALKHKDKLPDNGARIYLGLANLAEKTGKKNAHEIYFTAGAISFTVLAVYGLPNINFLDCFKKVQELSPPDSIHNKMAKIAIAGISILKNTHQPIPDIKSLNLDDLPQICQAVAILITKGEIISVEPPQNEIEAMFHILYKINIDKK